MIKQAWSNRRGQTGVVKQAWSNRRGQTGATTFQKGDKGYTGATGATGATGPAGPPGDPLGITWQSTFNFSSTMNTLLQYSIYKFI